MKNLFLAIMALTFTITGINAATVNNYSDITKLQVSTRPQIAPSTNFTIQANTSRPKQLFRAFLAIYAIAKAYNEDGRLVISIFEQKLHPIHCKGDVYYITKKNTIEDLKKLDNKITITINKDKTCEWKIVE